MTVYTVVSPTRGVVHTGTSRRQAKRVARLVPTSSVKMEKR